MPSIKEKLSDWEEQFRQRKLWRWFVIIAFTIILLLLVYINFLQTEPRTLSLKQISNNLIRAAQETCANESRLTRIAFTKMVENSFAYDGTLPAHGYIATTQNCEVAIALYYEGECAQKSIFTDEITLNEKEPHECYVEEDVFHHAEVKNLIANDYIPITNAADLAAIGQEENHVFAADEPYYFETEAILDGKYILINDVDMKDNDWQSIGSKDHPFTGTFDGNNYKIYNFNNEGAEELRESDEIDDIALFHTLDNAEIKNLALEGSLTGQHFLAPLAINALNTSVNNITINVDIDGNDYLGGMFVFAENVTINKSKINAHISGQDNLAGFLVDGENVQITNSYVTGQITGVELIADFIVSLTQGEIKNSYSLLTMNTEYHYRLAGIDFDDFTITSSYYGVEQFDYDFDDDNARLKEELQEKETFVNWDFENIWMLEENHFPVLR